MKGLEHYLNTSAHGGFFEDGGLFYFNYFRMGAVGRGVELAVSGNRSAKYTNNNPSAIGQNLQFVIQNISSVTFLVINDFNVFCRKKIFARRHAIKG